MNFQGMISVNNKIFKLLSNREHQDIAIYKNSNQFLRLGHKKEISNEVKKHDRLMSYGFPIPAIIDQGVLGDLDFYTELSLGNKHFGEQFSADTQKNGLINDVAFRAFLKISLLFAEVQLTTQLKKQNFGAFEQLIHLDLAVDELPLYRKRILEVYKIAKEKLSELPFVVTHGDFNPHNLYKKGVIDFEFLTVAPAGYDLISNIITTKYFPKNKKYEFYRSYDFSQDQHKQYLKVMDELYKDHGLPALSKYYKYFGFCRAMWHVCRMDKYPKLQKNRYNLFIRSYLK